MHCESFTVKTVAVAKSDAIKVGSSALLLRSYGWRSHFQTFRIRTQSLPDHSNFVGGLALSWGLYSIFSFKKISLIAEIALSEALCAQDE